MKRDWAEVAFIICAAIAVVSGITQIIWAIL